MGPIHDKFVSSWQLRILITGQPDKMLTDLRNSKGSRQLSAVWMKNLIRGVNQECFECCVFATHVLVLGKGKTYSSDTASLLLQPTTLAGATIPSRLVTSVLHAAFRQSVPSQILFSITLHFVPLYCNALFSRSVLLNWYMHHHHSVVQREPLLFREI